MKKNIKILMIFMKPLTPGAIPPPCIDNYAPDGQHIDSTMYIYSEAVYVHCVDDWNERGDSICLFHRLQ